ncbi:MAG: hypothetical protein WD768_19985 [Phycisphaeraceae bacterium]
MTGLLQRNDIARRTHVGSPSRPGSALILTIVCLVMMVLLGTAYVQVARIDRRATRQLTAIDNSATVRDAVIAYIAKVLKEDVISPAGNFFDPATWQESYDYPFTNTAVTTHWAVKSGRSDSFGAPLGDALGGQFDDTWLASTVIDERSGDTETTRWEHLTNLNGSYLRIPKPANGDKRPIEDLLSSAANNLQNDGLGEITSTRIDANTTASTTSLNYENTTHQKTGVDTDGDGIMDARWTWAPEEVRLIGGTSYIMAVRIIDLSSMINVNVGTPVTATNDPNSPAPTVSRGYFPSEIDITRVLAYSNRTANSGYYVNEINAARIVRGLGSGALPLTMGGLTLSANPVTPTAQASRAGAWLDVNIGARDYGYTNSKFALEDEYELRARGGLNTAVSTPLENAMPNTLRRDSPGAAAETSYLGIPGVNQWTDNWSIHGYMHGGHWDFAVGHYPLNHNLRQYWANRHWLTTWNGASLLAPRMAGALTPSANDSNVRMPVDLVHRFANNPTARAGMISERLGKVFKVGTPGYLGSNDANLHNLIAAEFAVSIQDYSDKDNVPSALTAGGVTVYGLELLPFFREAYLQARYVAVDTNNDMEYDEWQYEDDSIGFCVEIGNPFDKKIPFAAGAPTAPEIRLAIKQGTVLIDTSPLNLADMDPRDTGDETKEQKVIYSFPLAQGQNEGGKGNDLLGDLGLAGAYPQASQRERLGDGKLADGVLFTFDKEIQFELQVKVASGNWVTYDRIRSKTGESDGMRIQQKLAITPTNMVTVPDPRIHDQMSIRRDGRKNRYLSNKGIAIEKRHTAGAQIGVTPAYSATLDRFGQDDKGVTGDDTLDGIQIAHANHQIMNIAELGYIFMIGFADDGTDAATVVGDFPSRISGRDGTADLPTSKPARWFLSFTDENGTAAVVPNATKVPHAAMVFDQFTVFSPRYDLRDNDNDDEDLNPDTGVDNEEEQFVPGWMNVNTAPWWLMAMASPIPETMADLEQYYKKIGEYRDRPSNRAALTNNYSTALRTNNATDRGIASIGELMLIRPTPNTNTDSLRYAVDGAAIASTSPLRHYPHPDLPAADRKVFNEEYIAQERMARFHYLNSSLTTRSDRYCAYVVIRGYPSDNFSGNATDAMKFFVLFDRSKLVDVDSKVAWTPKTGQKQP